ncbi:MAG: LamG-like jellyroll fold domain-containing protein [Candidatus Pacearchaeota archaeon]|jgi:hypothetical protein
MKRGARSLLIFSIFIFGIFYVNAYSYNENFDSNIIGNSNINQESIHDVAWIGGEVHPNLAYPSTGLGVAMLWHLNEVIYINENISRTLDSSGKKVIFNGTVINATLVSSCKFGNCFDFYNLSMVKMASGFPVDTTLPKTGISGAAWIYIKSLTNNGAPIWESYAFNLGTSPSGLYCGLTNISLATLITTVYLPTSSELNRWLHVACVYDKNTKNLTLYVDGVAKNSKNSAFTNLRTSVIGIGNRPPEFKTIRVFDGMIDEFAIWDRALSSQEVLTLSQATGEITTYPGYYASFESNLINTGVNFYTIKADWEEREGPIRVEVSTDDGLTWAPINKGQTLNKEGRLFFPAQRFKYRVSYFSNAYINSINFELNESVPDSNYTPFEIGINLNGIASWESALNFVDLMKNSRYWYVTNASRIGPSMNNELEKIPKDENGYPLQVPYYSEKLGGWQQVGVVVRDKLYKYGYPEGNYTFSFEGDGKLDLVNNGGGLRYSFNKSGTYKVWLKDCDTPGCSSLIYIYIFNSTLGNNIRNIHLIMPGYEDNYETQIFYPGFLESLRNVSAIRFMDWQGTNNGINLSGVWENRSTPTSYTQSYLYRSVAIEYIINLSNRVHADPWVNIPHNADDNYIRQMARMMKNGLDPDRKVYVEYSNEVWNWMFYQTRYAYNKGIELNLNDSAGASAEDKGMRKFIAKRSCDIFNIFEQEFGGSERIVEVISTQAAGWKANELLNYSNHSIYPSLNPYGVTTDAIALAPYFGGIGPQVIASGEDENITIDEIIVRVKNNIYVGSEGFSIGALGYVSDVKIAADRWGVKLLAYEGGQHLVASSDDKYVNLTNKFIAANRDPRMGTLYDEYWQMWSRVVGKGPFMYFSHMGPATKYGMWGVMVNVTDTQSPKYLAFRRMVDLYAGLPITCIPEICGDHRDNDCDGEPDEGCTPPVDNPENPPGDSGSSGGSSSGGPIESPPPLITFNGKNLTISGVVAKNVGNQVCSGCNVNLNFKTYTLSNITDSEGKFIISFQNIDFSSGVNELDVSVYKSGEINNKYSKEIYI